MTSRISTGSWLSAARLAGARVSGACTAGFWPKVGSGVAAKAVTLLSIAPVVGGLSAYAPLKDKAGGGRTNLPPPPDGLLEEAEKDRGRLVGDRKRLNAQLLLGLQRLEIRAFLRQVGVHQVAHAHVDRVLQVADERLVRGQRLASRAELAERTRNVGDRGVERR